MDHAIGVCIVSVYLELAFYVSAGGSWVLRVVHAVYDPAELLNESEVPMACVQFKRGDVQSSQA